MWNEIWGDGPLVPFLIYVIVVAVFLISRLNHSSGDSRSERLWRRKARAASRLQTGV